MSKRFSFWRGVIIAYFLLFLLIALSSCKTTRRVVKIEETKEKTDSVAEEHHKESGFTITDIEEAVHAFVDKRTDGELFIYDTSRMYEEGGEKKAPLLVHYVTRDSIHINIEQTRTESDSSHFEKTDTISVDFHKEEEKLEYNDKDIKIESKVFSLFFLFVLVLITGIVGLVHFRN